MNIAEGLRRAPCRLKGENQSSAERGPPQDLGAARTSGPRDVGRPRDVGGRGTSAGGTSDRRTWPATGRGPRQRTGRETSPAKRPRDLASERAACGPRPPPRRVSPWIGARQVTCTRKTIRVWPTSTFGPDSSPVEAPQRRESSECVWVVVLNHNSGWLARGASSARGGSLGVARSRPPGEACSREACSAQPGGSASTPAYTRRTFKYPDPRRAHPPGADPARAQREWRPVLDEPSSSAIPTRFPRVRRCASVTASVTVHRLDDRRPARPRPCPHDRQDPARERAAQRRHGHRHGIGRAHARLVAARRSRRGGSARSCPPACCSRTSPACPPSSTWPRCATRWRRSAAIRHDQPAGARPTWSSTTPSRSTSIARPNAFAFNVDREYERNNERYQLLRWAQSAFRDFSVVPPGTGHRPPGQPGVPGQGGRAARGRRHADRLPGHARRHRFAHHHGQRTWRAGLRRRRHRGGGRAARPAALPAHAARRWRATPRRAAARLDGHGPGAGRSARCCAQHGVVGAFVEFAGNGLDSLALADRATISNMSPEYGATAALFPIDDETLTYLRLTGRRRPNRWRWSRPTPRRSASGAGRGHGPEFDETLELDLATVVPSVAGPRRPQDRVRAGRPCATTSDSNFPPTSTRAPTARWPSSASEREAQANEAAPRRPSKRPPPSPSRPATRRPSRRARRRDAGLRARAGADAAGDAESPPSTAPCRSTSTLSGPCCAPARW